MQASRGESKNQQRQAEGGCFLMSFMPVADLEGRPSTDTVFRDLVENELGVVEWRRLEVGYVDVKGLVAGR
jgi:hypothetical protein